MDSHRNSNKLIISFIWICKVWIKLRNLLWIMLKKTNKHHCIVQGLGIIWGAILEIRNNRVIITQRVHRVTVQFRAKVLSKSLQIDKMPMEDNHLW